MFKTNIVLKLSDTYTFFFIVLLLSLFCVFSGHSEEEGVHVSVVEFHDGQKTNLASSQIVYQHDGIIHLAQFLLDSVCSANALEELEIIKSENFNLADLDISTLDEKLDRALVFLRFPDWWSILGPDSESGMVSMVTKQRLLGESYQSSL